MTTSDNIHRLTTRVNATEDESAEQVKADLDAFINGKAGVPEYTYQEHSFWKLLGKAWNPVVEKAFGKLWKQWKGRRGWEGGAGNINYVFNHQKGIDGLTTEDAVEALEDIGWVTAPNQPRRKDSYMLVKKRQSVKGGMAMNVYVTVSDRRGAAAINAGIGVGASRPD